ncbi:ribokinase [Rugosimonospora africana]|uniref:Ribokinase n=1 Tax=Rugosimonospora africana TaxID=556532 RepID=A0A8J3QPT5_9ACTN|nr:ribokinase [Rugosimonospora africana]GIH14042.1 ribokinase [Rugosimonospora africana]
MSRVVVVGSANVDMIVRVEHLPEPGQTLLGTDVALRTGGKGANQAVAACRLGAPTLLYAAIGTDAFGRQTREALAGEGVCLDHLIEVDGSSTGMAMIMVAADGENTIVVAPGANHALDASATGGLAGALAPGAVLAAQLEVPIDTCLAAAGVARRAGARVVLNAAPLPDPGQPDFAALLRVVDVLIVNETEALALAGRPAPDTPAGWIGLAGDLLRHGPAACVITLGGQGAVAHDGTTGWAQPPFAADVVDTTGAGDAFCGALAASLAGGVSLADAVRRGCAAGALATGMLGAQAALPTLAQLERLLGEDRVSGPAVHGAGVAS